ncbi:phage tail tape-measure protein [Jiella endophytica]|uniref:Phage tail tape-measure protein n=1 Tax=Jiella endophytica TaxID=2558362 RepID=A0A4Y8RVF9_9HYPH|nr:tape measure protein [Jiella endophytica]TFF27511.1 phage tail tape-measure protein [Jiella endophytica]
MSNVTDGERLIVLVEARIKDLERNMAKASATTGREFGKMRRDSRSATSAMERDVVRSTSRINQALAATSTRIGGYGKAFAAGLAAYAGSKALGDIARFAAQYRDLQNALKVTGLEGEQLKSTFGSLSQIAMRQGAPLDALVTLYSRASQSSKELNASQGDLLKFSEGVATALRVAGTSATEAQGALLQLSQALGGGVIRAEEFNSVNEGARPILQAVANGLKEAGGSVSTLRSLVLDGKVSSEAFFRAFLAGSESLAEQAGRAEGTVSQSMSRIGTAMTLLIGHLDEVTGASKNATENLDAVAEVIQAMPEYIDAAARSFQALETWLDSVGNSPVWRRLGEMMGVDYSAEAARRFSQSYVGGTGSVVDDRIASAFDVTAGTGATTADKAARLGSKDGGAVSLKDFTLPSASKGGKGSKTAKDTVDRYERETRQIEEQTAAIEAETAAQAELNPLIDDYGFSLEKVRAEQDLLTAAKRAGVEVTPELREQIEQLATAYANAQAEARKLDEKQDLVRESAAEMRDLGKDVMGGFIQDLRSGTSAADALTNALGKIADKLADMALNSLFDPKGGGGLGGLFSAVASLFGGARAAGGPVNSGKTYLVGEKGPELFSPGTSGSIIPNNALAPITPRETAAPSAQAMPAGRQDVNVMVGVTVDKKGNLQAYVKDVADASAATAANRAVTDFSRHALADRVQQISGDPRRRG